MHLNPFERQPGFLTEMDMPSDFRMAGWVYILSNEYMPGIYKIGMTTTSPDVRAKELSSATGVPYPFKVEAAFHCDDPSGSESSIHESLSDYRINDSREFFKDELCELIYECEQHCEARVGDKVQNLAVHYDVISFEKLNELNLPSLYDDIGINVFGDKLAIAERLIRLGADFVKQAIVQKSAAIVFHDDKAYAIEDAEYTWRMKQQREYEEQIAILESAGIFGPQLPIQPIPF